MKVDNHLGALIQKILIVIPTKATHHTAASNIHPKEARNATIQIGV
jgi:hypothetical protein